MAQILAMTSIQAILFLALLLTVLTQTHTQAYCCKNEQLKETKMSVFFQDTNTGPNATVVPVAGIPGRPRGFFQFGTVFVVDDPITQDVNPNSPEIARGQGIFVTCSKDGKNTYVLVSIVFTNKEYNGSTLELQGRSIQLAPVREVSIVSGTGKFRFARGYATFETLMVNPKTARSTERCNLTVVY